MTIYSPFGFPVDIIRVTSHCNVRVQFQDGSKKDYHIAELKADGGYIEVRKAIESVAHKNRMAPPQEYLSDCQVKALRAIIYDGAYPVAWIRRSDLAKIYGYKNMHPDVQKAIGKIADNFEVFVEQLSKYMNSALDEHVTYLINQEAKQ